MSHSRRIRLSIAVVLVLVPLAAASAFTLRPFDHKAGGLTFAPDHGSCRGFTNIAETAHLPPGTQVSDSFSEREDGHLMNAEPIGVGWTHQADDTWTRTDNSSSLCLIFNGPGSHTLQLLDASGRVVVEGSFTLEP